MHGNEMNAGTERRYLGVAGGEHLSSTNFRKVNFLRKMFNIYAKIDEFWVILSPPLPSFDTVKPVKKGK